MALYPQQTPVPSMNYSNIPQTNIYAADTVPDQNGQEFVGPVGPPAGWTPTPTPIVKTQVVTKPSGSVQSNPIPNDFPMYDKPSEPSTDWDAIYAPAFQALDAAKAEFEGALPGQLQNIDRQAATEKQGIDVSQQTGEQQIGATKAKNKAEAQSSEADTRRMGSQLQQGLQSRFGGSTGTGQFMGEILGAGTVKSIAGLRQAYVTATAALDSALYQGKLQYDYQRSQIDQAAESSKIELQNNLRTTLAQLASQRAGYSVDKGAKRADALNQYRQELDRVNQQNTQIKQSLYSDWMDKATKISALKTKTEQERNNVEYKTSDTYYQTLTKAAEQYKKLAASIGPAAASTAVETQYNLKPGTLPDTAVGTKSTTEDGWDKLLQSVTPTTIPTTLQAAQ